MKYCKYCGKGLHTASSFCPYCMKSQIAKQSAVMQQKKPKNIRYRFLGAGLLLLLCLLFRGFLRLQTFFLKLLQTLLLGSLLFTQFFRLLLRLFFTLLFSPFCTRLLLLLAIIVLYYRTGIHHDGVDGRAPTAA